MSLKVYPIKDIAELLSQEYKRLEEINPGNHLLKYIKNYDSGFEFNPEEYDRFIQKFDHLWSRQSKYLNMERMLSNYYHHLRKAVDQSLGIDRDKSPNYSAMMKQVYNAYSSRIR